MITAGGAGVFVTLVLGDCTPGWQPAINATIKKPNKMRWLMISS
jgi:hypothetical protein